MNLLHSYNLGSESSVCLGRSGSISSWFSIKADSRRWLIGRDFTPKQGQYLAFIHAYTLVNGRAPAEADMIRFFRVTPPTVHQMVLSLEKAALISRCHRHRYHPPASCRPRQASPAWHIGPSYDPRRSNDCIGAHGFRSPPPTKASPPIRATYARPRRPRSLRRYRRSPSTLRPRDSRGTRCRASRSR